MREIRLTGKSFEQAKIGKLECARFAVGSIFQRVNSPVFKHETRR